MNIKDAFENIQKGLEKCSSFNLEEARKIDVSLRTVATFIAEKIREELERKKNGETP